MLTNALGDLSEAQAIRAEMAQKASIFFSHHERIKSMNEGPLFV